MVGKAQSPLLGFNNNVRHRGRVFHIQTEDSGIRYPHVITHLFADGGRILKSVKTSYAEFIGSENLEETVRNLMKEQHKSMFIALRDGTFDDQFEAAPERKPPPEGPGPVRDSVAEHRHRAKQPSELRASNGESRVDVDVLERAAAAAQNRSPLFGEETAPRPAAVPSVPRPGGSNVAAGTESASSRSDRTGVAPASKYTGSRPASIFGTSGPAESSRSVFGEEMISGKSLDEVILGFLSEEFGGPPEKDGGKEGG